MPSIVEVTAQLAHGPAVLSLSRSRWWPRWTTPRQTGGMASSRLRRRSAGDVPGPLQPTRSVARRLALANGHLFSIDLLFKLHPAG